VLDLLVGRFWLCPFQLNSNWAVPMEIPSLLRLVCAKGCSYPLFPFCLCFDSSFLLVNFTYNASNLSRNCSHLLLSQHLLLVFFFLSSVSIHVFVLEKSASLCLVILSMCPTSYLLCMWSKHVWTRPNF
jgi:hypothetical protein